MKSTQIIENKEIIIIRCPYTGKMYNITPLFTYMHEYDIDFSLLAEYMEDTGEILPVAHTTVDIYGANHVNIVNCTDKVNQLKKVFRKIKEVEL